MPPKSKRSLLLRWAMVPLFYLVLMPFAANACCRSGERVDRAETNELYIKVHFKAPLRRSALKAGDTVEGELSEAVYLGDRELFPAGSLVRLTVEKLERRRRRANNHWPWVIKAFAPRHENHPVFSEAIVFLPDGREVPLSVSAISLTDKREVQVKWGLQKLGGSSKESRVHSGSPASVNKQSNPGAQHTDKSGTTATFNAVELKSGADSYASPGEAGSGPAPAPNHARIEAGTQARVILLGEVRASRSRAGDVIAARLVEPIRAGSAMLPQGTIFEGRVVKVTRPRFLSRSGSMQLTFDRVILPGGVGAPVATSIIRMELDAESHTSIDPEGNLNAERPGKAWMLINLGASAGIAKASDDATELVMGLIISSAT